MELDISKSPRKNIFLERKFTILVFAGFFINIFLLISTLNSSNTESLALSITVFIFVLVFSFILILGVYKDIRDQEQLEELAKEMEVVNEHMKALGGQRTEFVSIASHQLRAPLTVIKGYASMILEGTFGVISDPVRDAVVRLYKSSERIVAIVEDLLTVSRLEQGRITLNLEPVNLVNFIQGMLSEIIPVVAEAGIDITFTAEENRQFIADIDSSKFKQVIKHILENAMKYTQAPGGIRVGLSSDSITRKFRLSVSDTGVGMTKEKAATLFDGFNLKTSSPQKINDNLFSEKSGTSESSTASSVPSADSVSSPKTVSGIGLYIAKQIIDAHHGNMHMESEGENRGSTVIVELPMSDNIEKVVV